jgi:hypothetical protein
MLVQVYGDNAMKKTAIYSGWNVFLREGKCHSWRESGWPATSTTEENIEKKLSNCAWKLSADCQEHSRAIEHQQRNSSEYLNWRTLHEKGVCTMASVVCMLASGTRVRGFKPGRSRWIFFGTWKNPQHAFLRNLSHVPTLRHVKEPSTSVNYVRASQIPV